MLRIKYLDSCYDEHSGVSIVRVATRYGIYEGVAREHPKEKYNSHLFGCQIAELRANIKAMKAALRFKNEELKGALRAYNECQTKQTHGVVKGIEKEACELSKDIKACKKELAKMLRDRANAIEELEQNKQRSQAPNVFSTAARTSKLNILDNSK